MSGLLRSVYGSEGVESGGGEVKLKVEKRGSHITIELTTDTSKAPIFVKTTEGEIESFKLLWEASSNVTNVMPLAVLGRCRTSTPPSAKASGSAGLSSASPSRSLTTASRSVL